MNPYDVPAEKVSRETMVENSKFISTLAPAFSVEEARRFIEVIKTQYSDATHNVPAFIIGYGGSETAHCTDAGEPSGTAGRPMLAVLHGSGLGDLCVVVTRYFGGTKLGTGGLVRAYSEAVRSVVEIVPRARKVMMHTIMVVYSYTFIERMRRLADAMFVDILGENFEADVTLTGRVLPEKLSPFQARVLEMTNGVCQVLVMDTSIVLKRIS
jgi:uncharacterized YigZ family protein